MLDPRKTPSSPLGYHARAVAPRWGFSDTQRKMAASPIETTVSPVAVKPITSSATARAAGGRQPAFLRSPLRLGYSPRRLWSQLPAFRRWTMAAPAHIQTQSRRPPVFIVVETSPSRTQRAARRFAIDTAANEPITNVLRPAGATTSPRTRSGGPDRAAFAQVLRNATESATHSTPLDGSTHRIEDHGRAGRSVSFWR